MADDDDSGEAFLRNHRTEAQNLTSPDSPAMSASSPPGRGVSGYGSRGTDQNKTDEYGSRVTKARNVNRRDKGAKGSGVIGSDEWNQNKYGGDGYN